MPTSAINKAATIARTHFGSAIVAFVVGIAAAAGLGAYFGGGSLRGALEYAVLAAILGVLEASLSLDNAVIDSRILRTMPDKWRRKYMTWGMAVSVLGMRLLFPLAIVAVAAHISPWATLAMAVGHPDDYARILTSTHDYITAFGGAFLLLISLGFFFDGGKEAHWLAFVERPMAHLGKVKGMPTVLTLAIVVGASYVVPRSESFGFLVSGCLGIVSYVLVKEGLGALVGEPGADGIVRAGIASFFYVEAIDASFSFDGVIGAFALTNNLFLIAVGLGIGAMCVRCLTMMMVKENVSAEFAYLGHGAYLAILTLAALMFLDIRVAVPSWITGCVGAAIIGLAMLSSVRANREAIEAARQPATADASL